MTLRSRRLTAFTAGLAVFYAVAAVVMLLSFPSGWLDRPLAWAFDELQRFIAPNSARCVLFLALVLPPAALGLLTQALLSGRQRPDDGHLHCLKCGYILKGLTVPRCPECGEPI